MNMQQMVQAMQKTQREFNKEYAKLEAKEFTGNANGVVEVKVMGDLTLKAVNVLDNSLLSADNKEELEDMIVLAFQKCKEQIQKESDAISKKFQQGAGGMMF
ncbi:MAG: YbaB/EbfC family nucleoid-associated protein [Bacilli bacterium]|jgi:nucleoid-associated protein EbfC